jgi:hypothetical protein
MPLHFGEELKMDNWTPTACSVGWWLMVGAGLL